VGSILGKKVGPQFTFRHVPDGLPKNRAQRSFVYLVMKDNG
jgi:hypothetical protein